MNRTRTISFILLLSVATFPAVAVAQSAPVASVPQEEQAKNILYIELATLIFSGAASINYERSADELLIFPSMALGMRIQPYDGGFFLRFGSAWTYGYGIGLALSLGAVF